MKNLVKLFSKKNCNNYLYVEICERFLCYTCVFPEEPVIETKQVLVDDVLSGLRHKLPSVRIQCCGKKIAESRWSKGIMIIEKIECPISIRREEIYVWGRKTDCGGIEECVSLVYES